MTEKWRAGTNTSCLCPLTKRRLFYMYYMLSLINNLSGFFGCLLARHFSLSAKATALWPQWRTSEWFSALKARTDSLLHICNSTRLSLHSHPSTIFTVYKNRETKFSCPSKCHFSLMWHSSPFNICCWHNLRERGQSFVCLQKEAFCVSIYSGEGLIYLLHSYLTSIPYKQHESQTYLG